MKQEDKELLLKDLCCRLPYYTLVYLSNTMEGFDSELSTAEIEFLINNEYMVKPYLFPLSSMTEEQKEEYDCECNKDLKVLSHSLANRTYTKTRIATPLYYGVDWLNANHFDYRGLIEKGLAIDATGLNIYKEKTK